MNHTIDGFQLHSSLGACSTSLSYRLALELRKAISVKKIFVDEKDARVFNLFGKRRGIQIQML